MHEAEGRPDIVGEILERGDRVNVRWKLTDEPRKAHEVIVLQPRSE